MDVSLDKVFEGMVELGTLQPKVRVISISACAYLMYNDFRVCPRVSCTCNSYGNQVRAIHLCGGGIC